MEAEAELACDARDVLPLIPVPVLLVGGDRDPYFPKEVYEETARLIPDCTLRMYEGSQISLRQSESLAVRRRRRGLACRNDRPKLDGDDRQSVTIVPS